MNNAYILYKKHIRLLEEGSRMYIFLYDYLQSMMLREHMGLICIAVDILFVMKMDFVWGMIFVMDNRIFRY